MNEPSGELQHLVPQEQDELPVTPPPLSTAHGIPTGNPLSPTSPSTKVYNYSPRLMRKNKHIRIIKSFKIIEIETV